MRVKELAGKTAFVTGAASGIGLGIATAFAQAGAKVMLCDIEEAALSAALKQLRLTNVDVDGVKADVSLKADLLAAAEATTARYGKVHILVNNAGVGGGGPYGTWTEASWNWTMGVNLMATIRSRSRAQSSLPRQVPSASSGLSGPWFSQPARSLHSLPIAHRGDCRKSAGVWGNCRRAVVSTSPHRAELQRRDHERQSEVEALVPFLFDRVPDHRRDVRSAKP
jgi:NAD(P)-dependent dehydrogenase (short-subunit alcohol dehydrogenase family)